MKKWYKKVIATTLLCFLFVFTNSFALPKWLESLLEKHPALVAVVNRIKQESPNKELNLSNHLDAAYALYMVAHPYPATDKFRSKDKVIDCRQGKIKVIDPTKYAPPKELASMNKSVNKQDIIDYCEDGIKVFGPSKSAPYGELFSWVKLRNGKVIYSKIPICETTHHCLTLPEWLGDLLKMHPALGTVVNRVKQESPNEDLNLGNDLDAAYALYLMTHQWPRIDRLVPENEIVDCCEGGIKILPYSKFAPHGALYSWIELRSGKVIYSMVPIAAKYINYLSTSVNSCIATGVNPKAVCPFDMPTCETTQPDETTFCSLALTTCETTESSEEVSYPTVDHLEQKSANKKPYVDNDPDIAYTVYALNQQNQGGNKFIDKAEVTRYCKDGAKILNSSDEYVTLFSWLEVPNRIIYSNISVTIDDDSTPFNSPDLG